MERVPLVAILVSTISLAACVFRGDDAESFVRHALCLAICAVIIAIPDHIEASYRISFRGSAHGGEPTPAAALQVVAWMLLIALIALHHFVRFA